MKIVVWSKTADKQIFKIDTPVYNNNTHENGYPDDPR